MSAADDLTLGEISRRLTRLEDTLTLLGAKIDGLSFVRQDVWMAEKSGLEHEISGVAAVVRSKADQKELDSIRTNLAWTVRTLIVSGLGLATAVIVQAIR